MKKILLAGAVGAAMTLALVSAPVRGQSPPPLPTIGGTPCNTPGCGIPPPPPPPFSSTNTPTPTATNTPTSTPTATPTNTPVPLTASVKIAHKSVKPGDKQKITVTTLPSASVSVTLQFPNGTKKTHAGSANSDGTFAWTFKQPSGKTTTKSNTVHVTVKVVSGNQGPLTKKKTYQIA